MDIFLNLMAGAIAASVFLFIAFPNLLFPADGGKKRRVGPVYWGVYKDAPTEEPESMKKIEVKKSAAKEKVIAGSAMYAKGRGTSFRM